MIKYLHTDYPSFITLFGFKVEANSEEEGRKKLLSVVRLCQQFAKGIQIHFHDDFFLFYDTEAHIRLVFQVKEPQDLILIKMSALFSFAASQHLTVINNSFFSK
ncbi:hypothetical protein [uncultured Parabacteroides sp.]|jgi:hypothetical protein|uniref:hypothetical protein n=1 Tax=uncultured Parabacteroides sp. TaxID=512312 RepID=UPI0026E57F1A|nr:hypothetical protein [uncultured Parabacteroides sp.]